MKDFDSYLALLGKPICMENGTKVTQLTIFECDDTHCLYGVTEYGKVLSWDIEGRFGRETQYPDMDLRLV